MTVMGTPNREPQELGRSIVGTYLPRPLFLFSSWGSLIGVPLKGLLMAEPETDHRRV